MDLVFLVTAGFVLAAVGILVGPRWLVNGILFLLFLGMFSVFPLTFAGTDVVVLLQIMAGYVLMLFVFAARVATDLGRTVSHWWRNRGEDDNQAEGAGDGGHEPDDDDGRYILEVNADAIPFIRFRREED